MFVKRATSDECCVSSKLNVASKKANNGRDFFRRLSTEVDSYKQVNPENMCNLIHFLIQQATLNNKSITFTKGMKQTKNIRFFPDSIDFVCSGMFVIFDSTNTIFEQFMKAKDQQKSGDDAKHSGYFKRLKYMGHQAIEDLVKNSKNKSDTFIYVRGDESSHYHGERGSKWDRTREYPAYGMDIPGACMYFISITNKTKFVFSGMPSGFGHILFGQLPSMETHGKYAGERIYIKPEFFGIRELKHFIKHTQSYFTHVSRRYVCQLKDMQTKPGCSKEDAFRENTDKKLLELWKQVLMTISTVWNVDEQYMKNATKFGLGEIDRQAKELEESGYQDKVKEFREKMLKQYGQDDISVRKGREIIFTTNGLLDSSLTCELLSKMKKC